MFSSQSTDISLNGPCRALDAIRGDKVDNRFIVGTCCVNNNHVNINHHSGNNAAVAASMMFGTHDPSQEQQQQQQQQTKNRLMVLCFQADMNELCIESEFDHFTGSISTLRSHPTDPSLVVTACEQGAIATLWKLPSRDSTSTRNNYQGNPVNEYDDDDYDNNIQKKGGVDDTDTMERVATLQHPDDDDEATSSSKSSAITSIAWREGDESSGDVVTIDMDGFITQWDVSFGAGDPTKRVSLSSSTGTNNTNKILSPPPRIMWDPHSNSGDTLAACYGSNVHILDWRTDTSIPSGTVDMLHNCHRYGVTDIHYNPNKPYVLATAGKDGLLKFWDIRSTKQHPVLTARGGHSHWVWNVQYNPFHDQLVLSTGTDSVVNLWRLSTISSAPLLAYDDDDVDFVGDSNNPATSPTGSSRADGARSDSSAPNVLVGRYEHTDSVYAAAWGAADAWIYMTVGYEGKAVLNHVPSQEKYKILL